MPAHDKFRKVLPAAGAAAFALALAGCMEDKLAGSTTTGNSGKGAIAGRVVDAGGNGVAGARVRVVPVDHNPGPGGSGGIADIVTTGADGGFLTDSLPDGSYNLFSDKGGSLAFRDSVPVQADAATDVGRDTLKAAGSVAGVVRLQPGHDSRTVFLILPGTTTFAVPEDSIGNFRLANLAEGTYRLRLLSTLDAYQPLDTAITVVSAASDAIPDTLRLPYRPVPTGEVPVIDDLSLSYDSTAMAATLRWQRRDPDAVGSYHVYRRDQDSGFVRLTVSPIPDTVFIDDWKSGIRPGRTYHYAVTALDPRGNEGRKGEAAIFTMRVRFRVEPLGSDCSPAACQTALGPDGHLWVYESNGAVSRWNGGLFVQKWFDSAGQGGQTRPLAVDDGQSVYILDPAPLRLRKLTAEGKEVWRAAVPSAAPYLSLHHAQDSLLLWDEGGRVMTAFAKDGTLLGQDTLFGQYQPPTGLSHPSYQTGIGFHTVVSSAALDWIEFHDRDGRTTSTWRPEPRGYLRGLARGEDGRWYLAWSSHVVDVYSPGRSYLATLLAGGEGPIRAHAGFVYMQRFPGQGVCILTGL